MIKYTQEKNCMYDGAINYYGIAYFHEPSELCVPLHSLLRRQE